MIRTSLLAVALALAVPRETPAAPARCADPALIVEGRVIAMNLRDHVTITIDRGTRDCVQKGWVGAFYAGDRVIPDSEFTISRATERVSYATLAGTHDLPRTAVRVRLHAR